MIYRFIAIAIISLFVIFTPSTVGAADPIGKGLAISPLRQEVTLDAGKTTKGMFTVSNLTNKPMLVNMSVKQFSATNYIYDYEFRPPDNDWVKLQVPQVQLQPGESRKISYDVILPPKVAPGGYYYTVFVSTDIDSGLPSTVQAATLIYLTVNGDLIRTSLLQNDSIPFWVTGTNIPYKFDVKDTGNVHFSAYFYGQLEGIFGKLPESGTSHIVMPGTVRTIEGVIPSPLLPGIYRVTYGYKVDFADFVVAKSAWIIFIPPWSVVVLVFLLIGARWGYIKWRNRTKNKEK